MLTGGALQGLSLVSLRALEKSLSFFMRVTLGHVLTVDLQGICGVICTRLASIAQYTVTKREGEGERIRIPASVCTQVAVTLLIRIPTYGLFGDAR